MNGVEAIRDRILREAEMEADRICREAEARAAKILEQKQEQAALETAELERSYRERSEDLKKRQAAVARLELRKQNLAVRQALLDAAFEACLQMAQTMPAEAYSSILRDLLLLAVSKGTETVLFSARDSDRLPKDFIKGINQTLSEQGLTGALQAGPPSEDFQAGFVLCSGGMEMNYSFEAMLRIVRDEIEPKAAEVLFGAPDRKG
jgi:V/A-type H+-transporting ATPase subunit E